MFPSSTMHLLVCILLSFMNSAVQGSISETGFGYVAETDVSQILNLALDIRDMRMESNLEEKKKIYFQGANAQPYTLAGLSLNSSQYNDFPLYNVYKYAFSEIGVNLEEDEPGYFDNLPVEEYGNTLVLDLFILNRTRIEADGALVINVAMAYWGSLNQMLQACERKGTREEMVGSLDKSAALWVGQGQERTSNVQGFMLYNLAELAGTNFEQDESSGESLVNVNVLERFVSIKNDIDQQTCESDGGYLQVREKIKDLIKYTNIVLVQMLLHHIEVTEDSDFIELYSLALLPQIGACNAGASETLLELTVQEDVTDQIKSQIISALQESYTCLQINCKDVGAYEGGRIPECQEDELSLAGYVPLSDVREKSHIDRDLRYINMFMRLEAYNAVRDVYNYGWNTFFSLKQLATNTFNVPVTSVEYERFQIYLEDDNFADNQIMNVLDSKEPFETASSVDRTEIVVGILEGMVLYSAMISELESSISACGSPDQTPEPALFYWDSGVAFYIGSMEGGTESLEERGQLLFSVAKSLCADFKTCEEDAAAVNRMLQSYFEFGRNALSDGDCHQALAILQSDIKPYLLIPVIQATLKATTEAADGVDGSAGKLFAFSRVVLPAVDEASRDDATVVKSNSDYSPDRRPNIEAVFGAFRAALPSMNIDCERIGELMANNVLRGVCEDDISVGSGQQAPSPLDTPSRSPIYVPPPDPNGLAWGRYAFSNQEYAENDSKFSLDVRDMANSASIAASEDVYTLPSKYVPTGLSGDIGLNSLSDFSTRAVSIMSDDPLYNFFRVAFYDDEDFEEAAAKNNSFPYADTIVRLALNPEKGDSQKLASDASVVMNTFMLMAHRLYEAVRRCQQQVDAGSMIDSAVGLWIGQEQAEGKFDTGWMLYSQAQRAIKAYGSNEKESEVNSELMDLFNEAQQTAATCIDNAENYMELNKTRDSIIRALSKILLQQMLFYISENDRNYVELFSLALIPQVGSCNQGTYNHLRDSLFLDFDRIVALDDGLVSSLSKGLHCLRFSCKDLGDTTNASSELKSLVAALCTQMDNLSGAHTIAGYETDDDVSELSRIDLDILQIELFMKTRSYDLAADYYINGHNSLDGAGNPVSLQSLAIDDIRTNAGDTYDLYQEYFQSGNYTDDIILSAIRRDGGAFDNASRRQLSEVVFRTLQTMVPYMQIISRLRLAISRCKASESGQTLVDQAAALFVGSIEGTAIGGDEDGGGRLLFALGKETCDAFDKCESHDDAAVNEFILVSLRDMKRSMSSQDCDSASTILEDAIKMFPVPMIQGSLSLAVENANLNPRSDAMSLSTAFVLSSALLPLVKEANQTSAATILNNMDFNLDQKPVVDGPGAIFDAFHGALPGMGVNCHYVGSLEDAGLSACEDLVTGEDTETPTNLGEDLYVTTTYVQDRANIALDVKTMLDALSVGREALARIVYREGENSPVYDKNGVKVDLRSLGKLSTNARNSMTGNPLYQISVYALRDSKGQYLGQDARDYADTVVQEAFTIGAPQNSPIAAEAAVALNLWMELANELFQTLTNCKDRKLIDDDGVNSIDEAVAYWIGDGQIAGDSQQGHLLYALAERMGDNFQINESGQSKTNINILRLFHQAKIELSLPDACSGGPVTYRRLRHVVDKITSQMVIVNVQALIHNLRVGDRPRVRIYAHAFVPLVAACSPSTFSYLRGKLLDFTYNEVEVDSIVEAIRSTYPCFSIGCEDIGVHTSEESNSCSDPDDKDALAGYRPATDVRNFAKLDFDIQELDILLRMEAYGPAEDLYSYGKHTATGNEADQTSLSLEYLATDPGRSAVPEYVAFKQYFGEDERYADTIVRYALQPNSDLSVEQRRLVVIGTAQYMILNMAAMMYMEMAVTACDDGSDNAEEYWDTAASWLIGHLEGSSEAGSDEGRLLWSLAKKHCEEFNTCSHSVPGSAEVNDQLVLRLYTGRGAALARTCTELRKTATEVQSLWPISLIQAALSTAMKLRHSSGDRRDQLLAEGYVYSHSVLPLIKMVNANAAQTIAASFDLARDESMPLGLPSLVAAYSSSLSAIGVNCEDVGSSETIDVCAGTVESSKVGLIVGLIIGILALFAIAFAVKKKVFTTDKPEDNPIFKNPCGELNHAADFASEPSPSDNDPEDSTYSEDETDEGKEDDISTFENDEESTGMQVV